MTLFCGNLPNGVTAEELYTVFGRKYEIRIKILPKSMNSRELKTCAFIDCGRREEADALIASHHRRPRQEITIRGHVLMPHLSNENFRSPAGGRLYLAKVPHDLLASDISAYFSKFGKVNGVQLRKRRNPPAGFYGILEFADTKCVYSATTTRTHRIKSHLVECRPYWHSNRPNQHDGRRSRSRSRSPSRSKRRHSSSPSPNKKEERKTISPARQPAPSPSPSKKEERKTISPARPTPLPKPTAVQNQKPPPPPVPFSLPLPSLPLMTPPKTKRDDSFPDAAPLPIQPTVYPHPHPHPGFFPWW